MYWPTDRPLPDNLERMRAATEAEIEVAFAGVRRTGISWSETMVIDLQYVSECRAERRKDQESSWRQLVDDPNWDEFPGIGGFPFLDPLGVRYYFPAALLRCLRPGEDGWLVRSYLTLDDVDDPDDHKGFIRNFLERWSALNLPQRQSIRSFIVFMLALDEEPGPEPWRVGARTSQWRKALETWDWYVRRPKLRK
jgi:hypothetical protein